MSAVKPSLIERIIRDDVRAMAPTTCRTRMVW